MMKRAGVLPLHGRLFTTMVLATLFALPARSQTFPYKSCHIETGRTSQVSIKLDFQVSGPRINATEWLLVAPSPPALAFQTNPAGTISIGGSSSPGAVSEELSPEHRKILTARVPADNDALRNGLSGNCAYQVSLTERHLRMGPADGGIAQLSPSERDRYLSDSETLNFKDPAFKNFMHLNGFEKGTQRELDFAWLVFNRIRDIYSYEYHSEQDRRASALCTARATDCGGLSWMFESVLRANGIPTCSLIGRWADPQLKNLPLQGAHVKSEFYAEGVGWIPVELSGAVTTKSAPAMNFFGQDAGNFLTLHVDPDLVIDTIWFGKSTVRALQTPMYWATGSGNFDGATYEDHWRFQKVSTY